MPEPLKVSVSAIRAFQQCEQLYDFRYIKFLRKRARPVAPELGIVLHDYLNHYYSALRDGSTALKAHAYSLDFIAKGYTPRMRAFAEAAREKGDTDLARDILAVPGRAERIAGRYFAARGLADANRYIVLASEIRISTKIAPGIINNGYVDLITEDRVTGRIHIWEHKSTSDAPPTSIRLRDLQTFVYASIVDEPIDAINWNYLRTKEPAVPDLVYKGTKREGLTRRSDLDSTWEVYLDAIKAHGLNVEDYEDMRPRLSGRELSDFFPRYEQVIVVDDLFTDFIQTAFDIRAKRKAWASEKSVPVKSLGFACRWCDYADLCMTSLTGGDVEDVIELRYTSERLPEITVGASDDDSSSQAPD